MKAELRKRVITYKDLIDSFVSNNISAHEFEVIYLRKFKDEDFFNNDTVFEILNDFFISFDAYWDNVALRDEFDLDEAGLLSDAQDALKKLGSGPINFLASHFS